MSVMNTDQWLMNSWDNPIQLCEYIKDHFKGVSVFEIYQHLVMHGMYHTSLKNGKDFIRSLRKNNIWKIIQKEEQKLRKLWKGPNIPIYIFPSDPNNRKLREDFNGKSGLAYADKLFLFVSDENSENEIKALFTHEYNHVCRLMKLDKKEKDYVLLDTIILEGLAENAVFERLGDKYTANWTKYYSKAELRKMWHHIIMPYRHTPKDVQRHQSILFGLHFYPKMVGYCVGYYLVKKYLMENKLTSKELLGLPSSKIAQV